MKNSILFCFLLIGSFCKSQTSYVSTDTGYIFNWQYAVEEDKMTSAKIYSVVVASRNIVNIESVGSSLTMLYLTNRDSINILSISITKGKLNYPNSEPVQIRLRLDENPPKYVPFKYLDPSTADGLLTNYSYANSLIQEMKKSKRLRIQLEFQGGGAQIIDFNLDGFKWDHFGKEQ